MSGYLIDASTKETLIGATVYLSDKGTGVITDPVSYTHLDVYKRQHHGKRNTSHSL